ncbi:MAG: LamG domain-containing protein [archaeon]
MCFNNKFGSKNRAQSSVETLIILATGLFILSALTVMVYEQLNSNYYQQQQKIGSNAINTLAKEINDAYFLGPGTVKNVIITMPSMVDYDKSYIEGKYLILNVAGSDLFASTKVNVRGIWPNTSGSFVFVITSFDDFVSVSTQPISFSPSQISEALQQDSSMDVNVVVTNSSASNMDYNLVINFAGNESEQMVSSSVSQISFVAGTDTTVPFSLACLRDSFGSYSGSIVFVPLSSSDSNISFPVNLVCSSSQTKLSIYPSLKTINSSPNGSSTVNLLVCNNSSTKFSGSSALVSGEISSYAFTSFSGDINANSCRTLYLGILAPSTEGAYSGLLRVDSSGYTAYSDLNLIVTQAVNDIVFDWNGAYYFDDGNSVIDINMSNNGSLVTVTELAVLFVNDIDDANLVSFSVNGQNKLPVGTKVPSMQWINVTDFNLSAQTIYDVNLVFDENISNDSEKIRVVLKLSDNNSVWSSIFDPTEMIVDNNQAHFSNLLQGQQPIYLQDQNLVALWRLNDKNSGGWIMNSVSGVRDGNLRNGADVNAIGLGDTNAGFFDGVDDYISSNLLDGNTTISFWAKGADNNWNFFVDSNGTKYVNGVQQDFNNIYYSLENSVLNIGRAAPLPNNDDLAPNLYVWYDFSDMSTITKDSSGFVSYVEDKGGRNNDLIQATASKWPVFDLNGLNGKSMLDFNGTQGLGIISTDTMTQFTFFVVEMISSGDQDHYPVVFGDGTNTACLYAGFEMGGPNAGGSGNANNLDLFAGYGRDDRATLTDITKRGEWKLLSATSDTTVHNSFVWAGGVAATMTPQSSDCSWSLQLGNGTGTGAGGIGGSPASFIGKFTGSIEEVILYNRALSTTERMGIEKYLSQKYNLSVTGDYNSVYSYFNGSIDEVAIWDTALSTEEVREIYSIGSGVHDFNTQADVNGLYLSGSTGSFLSDGNFYSRVFDFNGLVDFNKIFFNKLVTDSLQANYYLSAPMSNDYSKSSFVSRRPDSNLWIANGELDWNALDTGLQSFNDGDQLSSENLLFDSNLVGLWHLNDKNSNGWVLNSATSVRDGNLIGGVDVNATGLWDTNAGWFDGSTGYVSVGNFDKSVFTFSAWVKRERISASGLDRLFLSVPSNGWGVYFETSNKLTLTKVGVSNVSSIATIADTNVWHHIVVAYNGSNAFFYIDGNLDSSPAYSTTFSSGGAYSIGSRGAGEYFKGNIEEIAIWDRVLTEEEVSSLYSSHVGEYVYPNLSGLWHLNESGSSFADSSGNGNTASCSSCPSVTSGLWDSNARSFSGGIYIDANNQSPLDATNKLTISAWIKMSSSNSNNGIVFKGPLSSSQGVYSLGFFNGSSSNLMLRLNGSTSEGSGQLTSPNVLPVGSWVHVVATYDGASMKLYVNGLLDANNSYSTAISTNTDTLKIGCYYNTSYCFLGSIDEVAVWKQALSYSEVQALYQAQKGMWVDNNLVAYYKFNEKSGTTIFDSARGNNGTLTSGADTNAIGLWDTNAGYFDGVDDYVSVPDSSSIRIGGSGNSFAISFWTKLARSSGTNMLISSHGGGCETFGFVSWFDTTYGLAQQIRADDGSCQVLYITPYTRIPLNSWIHVVFDYNTTDLVTYVNGTQMGITHYVGYMKQSTVGMNFGRNINTGDGYLQGLIDEVKIYNRSLSATEIQADYNQFLNSKFVDSNIVDAGSSVDWNNVRVNKNVGYSFGKEIEDWNTLKLMGVNELGQSVDSNYLFDSNLVGLWHLNESSGTSFTDSSGNGNDGSCTNCPTPATGLWDTNAQSFDGSPSHEYISIDNRAGFPTGNEAFTFSAWVRPTDISNATNYQVPFMVGNMSCPNGVMFFVAPSTSKISIQWHCGYGRTDSVSTLNNGKWYHIAATYSGSVVKIFLNGVLENSTSYSGSNLINNSAYISDSAELTSTREFYGSIDEVAIWNRALSDSEIKDLYYSQSPSFHNSLVGLWHLNETSGTLEDLSGYNNDGTNNGAASTTGLWDTNAYDFDGGTDFINVPNSTSLQNVSGGYTISVWAYPTALGDNYGLVCKGALPSSGPQYCLSIMSGGSLWLGSSGGSLTSNSKVVTNKWQHIVGVYDGAGTGKIYIDGVLDKNGSHGATTVNQTEPLFIGKWRTNYEYYGKIEEAAVWSRALSASEVSDLYRKGVSRLDLNVYSCSDASCLNKASSVFVSDANNGSLLDISSLSSSQYLGFDVFFKQASGFDGNANINWLGSFLTDANVLYGSSTVDLNLFVRSSTDGVTWFDWNSITGANPQDLLIDNGRFFQYKAVLHSESVDSTPYLRDVNVSYTRIDN